MYLKGLGDPLFEVELLEATEEIESSRERFAIGFDMAVRDVLA